MLLRRVRIDGVRSVSKLDWTFATGTSAGWHVILGNNGSGKSSVLQAIALGLIGEDWPGRHLHRWIRRGSSQANIELDFTDDGHFQTILDGRVTSPAAGIKRTTHNAPGHPIQYFSCGFGSMRRFGPRSYGDERSDDEAAAFARHATLFKQDAVLTDALEWLQDLEFRALKAREKDPHASNPSGILLDKIRGFINDTAFLPYGAKLGDVTPDAIEFRDGNDVVLAVEELSDGYRSVLGIAFELIRRLTEHYDHGLIWSADDPAKIVAPGIVLIDEVDAHLHPSWQQRIGYWFTDWFPHLQFVVTTHSPLVCQAAERGSVLRLPEPGVDERPRVVEGLELERLLYGNVLDAYATPSFGRVATRSDTGQAKLARLAELNQKSLHQSLSDDELDEREHLLRVLPTNRLRPLDAAE